jgi:hypothetical protein
MSEGERNTCANQQWPLSTNRNASAPVGRKLFGQDDEAANFSGRLLAPWLRQPIRPAGNHR